MAQRLDVWRLIYGGTVVTQSAPGCIGNTILTSSGVYFDFNDPQIDQIFIEDIATALGNTCRFAGQIGFYSVAEHCVHCSQVALQRNPNNIELAFHALMHDAAEAYIGDMPKPLKVLLPDFQAIEARVERVIEDKFDLTDQFVNEVKTIDLQLLKAEKKHLFPSDREIWTNFETIDDVDINFGWWHPHHAAGRFLDSFVDLNEAYLLERSKGKIDA